MPDETEPLLSKVSSWESNLMIDLITINLNATDSEEQDSDRASSPVFAKDFIFQIQLNVNI